MTRQAPTIEVIRAVFILIVGVLGLVLVVWGLLTGEVGVVVVGVIFVVACIMGEGLSHFAVGRGRLTMGSRAKPTSRRRN